MCVCTFLSVRTQGVYVCVCVFTNITCVCVHIYVFTQSSHVWWVACLHTFVITPCRCKWEQISQATLSRTGFDTNICGGRFSRTDELLANEHVGFFALMSSGHGILIGYTWPSQNNTYSFKIRRKKPKGESTRVVRNWELLNWVVTSLDSSGSVTGSNWWDHRDWECRTLGVCVCCFVLLNQYWGIVTVPVRGCLQTKRGTNSIELVYL